MSRLRILVITLFCALINVFVVSPLMVLQAIFGSSARAYKASIGIDQAGNALLGGSEDETISSRTGRLALEGKSWALALEKVINAIFGDDHCRKAIGM